MKRNVATASVAAAANAEAAAAADRFSELQSESNQLLAAFSSLRPEPDARQAKGTSAASAATTTAPPAAAVAVAVAAASAVAAAAAAALATESNMRRHFARIAAPETSKSATAPHSARHT